MWSNGNPAGGRPQNRYYPRLEAEILFAYRPLAVHAEQARVVKSRSLGLGGLMFEDECQLPVGDTYVLDLVFGENRMEVQAAVVYSNRIGPNLYRTGFSFSTMSDEKRESLTVFFLQEYDKRPREGP